MTQSPPSPRFAYYSPDPMALTPSLAMAGQPQPLPPPGATEDDAATFPFTVAGGHMGASADVQGREQLFPLALDAAADPQHLLAPPPALQRRLHFQQQKGRPAKRFKSPTVPISPLVPTRSTGLRIILSPRLMSPSTTSANSPSQAPKSPLEKRSNLGHGSLP